MVRKSFRNFFYFTKLVLRVILVRTPLRIIIFFIEEILLTLISAFCLHIHLLKENKMTVSEVGYSWGFSNLNHLAKVFE